ncbi:TonB-dependent receptor plug domain-containing protein [Robertkochia sediminum]|uniref:TonB-dependent receptor plug domain-containing protein n=1 Tax=Robertkochia sediminum TaxID=2785326 RepID=UPI0019332A17|nr:carboxypeptidase regulatory-like domain-containing protein [Robertkochia sediminum]MBL7473170.1 carboxypeptidase regulatory-like domain-containing protein [Robertkochia sediminum]
MKRLLLFLVMLGVSAAGFSQVTTANIKGLVTDSQNEPLPGASVVAVHTPTGTRYGGATNFDGRVNLLNLRVGGPYTLTFSYIGFQSQEITDVYLELGKTTNIDVVMSEDSQQLDEVVVSADRSGTFGSDRTGAETSVGRKELTRLPTISRSAQDFTRLEPTASGNSFGGRNDQYNNFSLDGAIFNNPFGLDAATPGGQTDSQPISIDAIEQIQVSVAPYDVTLSGFTGASVNAVTKSGTNEIYGTAYGFFRNEDLTGGKIKGDKVVKPKLEQNQYGFSLGGPIVKNKVFFFANFERDVRTDIGTAGFVPNTGSGAINESRVTEADLIAVQDALSTIVIGQDANGNDIFYNPGAYEGFTYGAESTKGIFKIDWNINDKNRLAVIYNFLNASKEKPAHPTALGFRGPNTNTLQFENAGYEINNNIQSVQVELNSTLSDVAVNKLQMGYTHFDDFRNPLSTPAPSITIQEDGSNYIIAGHEPFSVNNTLDQKVFQVTDNFNLFLGEHTLTAGVSFEKFEFDNSFNLGAYGAAGTFFPTADSVESFLTQVANGDIQAQFDQAIATNQANNANDSWALAETNVGQFAFYLQDEWNLSTDFKVTAGIRFDKPLYFDTADKIRENIDRKGGAGTGTYQPDIVYFDPETGEEVNFDSTQLPNNDFLISPRLGFNWDVKGDNTFKVRGGSGVFTGRFPFVWLGNQVQGVDFFFYQVVDPDFQWPQVWRNSLGADYRFENGLVLTADLSYTKDLNAAHVQNWGLNTPSGTLQGVDGRPVYENTDKSQIFGGPTSAFVFTNSDKGRIWNAAFKAQKTFDNGMFASLAYSYLNAKDVNSIEAEITGDAFVGNPVAGNANTDVLGFSKYGDTHRFVGVISKQFQYGQGRWATTISAFAEYAQGGRFNYTYAGDINNDGSNFNDLLYIPTAAELQSMNFATEEGRQAFENYIAQDDYLSENRGQIADRYAALAPWRSRWDVKILQDYNFKVAGNKTNTIQFSIDILNFGNMLNSNWGVVQVPNNIQPVSVSVDDNNVPTYDFNPSLTNTFSPLSDVISRWQAQFGLRYIFN